MSKLRNLGIGKDNLNSSPPFTADEFNSFLCNARATDCLTPDKNKSSCRRHRFSYDANNIINSSSPPLFSFRGVSIEETLKSIKQVTSKAVGLDDIPISFIKMTLPVTLPYISHLFNFVLTSMS